MSDFFNKSVLIFQDDFNFSKEIQENFFGNLSLEMRMNIQDNILAQLDQIEYKYDASSKDLQLRCKYLYILGLSIDELKLDSKKNTLELKHNINTILTTILHVF